MVLVPFIWCFYLNLFSYHNCKQSLRSLLAPLADNKTSSKHCYSRIKSMRPNYDTLENNNVASQQGFHISISNTVTPFLRAFCVYATNTFLQVFGSENNTEINGIARKSYCVCGVRLNFIDFLYVRFLCVMSRKCCDFSVIKKPFKLFLCNRLGSKLPAAGYATGYE